ncbi:dUTP diphosphatase [Neocallimastix californiae]|uniref:Deoxyuridine 5'-triphosphate nucleotidohydrolase n=1 Tax=Neocallimastix californiae TaxID=1754190 RepID=A0A1Y2FFR9_9FUNG|nr:dUTP diphosphatase [Neocallimastix californiae]|eukprot:ORY81665.1 dUTP diphosphatase [Neocallimastix californiae]
MDLRSAYDEVIPPNSRKLVKTDIAIKIPRDCYGRIAPRSGLAFKHFIDLGGGVVDSDYRGNVGVIMFNFGEKEFVVKKGDRIAQLILERIYIPEVVEVDELDETTRGAGGFGSTGRN